MDKDDDIKEQINRALFELDKAYDCFFNKKYCDAIIAIKMAKIDLVKIKRVLGDD